MIGWLLLIAAASCFTTHAYLTSGVEGALMMAGTLLLLAGIWKKVEDVHDKMILHRKIQRQRWIGYED